MKEGSPVPQEARSSKEKKTSNLERAQEALESSKKFKYDSVARAKRLYDFFVPKIKDDNISKEQRGELLADYKNELTNLENMYRDSVVEIKTNAGKLNMEEVKEDYLTREEEKTHLVVQTAVFFDERAEALRAANPDTQALANFSKAGREYFQVIIDMEQMAKEMLEVTDSQSRGAYQEEMTRLDTSRSHKHDAIITAINELNSEAKQAGTKPFTSQNFLIGRRDKVSGQRSAQARNDRKLAAWYAHDVFRNHLHSRVPKGFDP